MASSVSGQDEPNRVLWLATWTSKKELFCPLRITRHVLQEMFRSEPNNKSFSDQAFSVKMSGYWPSVFFFLRVYGLRWSWGHKRKKKELGQYPAILTSRLVNNPYLLKYATIVADN